MPELPEVESVCRLMRRVMTGKKIMDAEVWKDDIVLGDTPPEAIRAALVGKTVTEIGRKGKYWWIQLKGGPYLFGHLGMSGWIRELETQSMKLLSHGKAPLDDENGNPRFAKLVVKMKDGSKIAFTDPRRLGRLWLGDNPKTDKSIKKLGFDVLDELPNSQELEKILGKRKVSIKGVLLDQTVFAGVGNWIADEVLYQSRIAPARPADSLSAKEVERLRGAVKEVVTTAVAVDADYSKYPDGWMFTNRWGGKKGKSEIDGHPIVREQIAGRTTAWVPEVQK